jgi:hypothetical protein
MDCEPHTPKATGERSNTYMWDDVFCIEPLAVRVSWDSSAPKNRCTANLPRLWKLLHWAVGLLCLSRFQCTQKRVHCKSTDIVRAFALGHWPSVSLGISVYPKTGSLQVSRHCGRFCIGPLAFCVSWDPSVPQNGYTANLPTLPRAPPELPRAPPEHPRASQSTPKFQRAPQSSPEHPRAPQRPSEHPRVPQSSPERPRAAPQSTPELPRAPQSTPTMRLISFFMSR